MKRGLILGAAMFSALVAVNPAFAQATSKRFEVQLSARATRDDNVSRSNSIIAATRGLRQEDTILSPNLSVDIMQPIGRQALFLAGDAGYNFYEHNDRLNRERVSLRGGGMADLGPCNANLSGGYSRQQSSLEDLSVGLAENVETTTSASFNTMCGRPIGLAATVDLKQEWADNSAAQRQSSDYASSSATLGLQYRRPTFGELTLFGSYGETKYDRLIPVGALFERDGYDTYAGGVQFTRRIGSRLKGSVSAGYTSVRPHTSTSDDFNGFTYGVDLTFRPSGRLEAQAAFSRAVQPSNRLDTTYALDETYSLQGSYSMGRRLRFTLGGSYTDSSYERTPLATGNSVTAEETKSVFASVRFDLNDRLAFTVDASQQERDANIHGFDYTANRMGLSVVATY